MAGVLSTERLRDAVRSLVDDLRSSMRRQRVTQQELQEAIGFLAAAARRGVLDVLARVLLGPGVAWEHPGGEEGPTAECEAGPFYLPGAPLLTEPYMLPQRADEPGEPLFFSGSVHSTDGRP